MSDKTAIEWTDATWNPVLGCDKVSEGCRSCYAINVAWQKQHNPNEKIRAAYEGLVEKRADGSLNWTGRVNFIPERLEIPLRWKQPKRIFVNSLSDLFHKNVSDDQIAQVFAIMLLCQRHTFQVLTKRPERMAALLNDEDFQVETGALAAQFERGYGLGKVFKDGTAAGGFPSWPNPNIWLGTSTEDQKTADERIPHLLATPAAVRFLSMEPLLGPIDLRSRAWHDSRLAGTPKECPLWRANAVHRPHTPNLLSLLDWVITGGESGAKARPMHPDWARSLRDQCAAAGVAFFHKQHGGRTPKAAGRLLDGVEHSAFPTVAAGAAS